LLREMFNEPDLPQPQMTNVGSMSKAVTHLKEHAVDIILLDLDCPMHKGWKPCDKLTPLRRMFP